MLGFLRNIIYSHIHNKFGDAGGFKFQKAPPKPPKKVRKFYCFEALNGRLPCVSPMKYKITPQKFAVAFIGKGTTPLKYMYE